jgi:hypothetical protein
MRLWRRLRRDQSRRHSGGGLNGVNVMDEARPDLEALTDPCRKKLRVLTDAISDYLFVTERSEESGVRE